ncbi:hypothetical protein AOLI_G00173460 [Acnodon oligacanthus]
MQGTSFSHSLECESLNLQRELVFKGLCAPLLIRPSCAKSRENSWHLCGSCGKSRKPGGTVDTDGGSGMSTGAAGSAVDVSRPEVPTGAPGGAGEARTPGVTAGAGTPGGAVGAGVSSRTSLGAVSVGCQHRRRCRRGRLWDALQDTRQH